MMTIKIKKGHKNSSGNDHNSIFNKKVEITFYLLILLQKSVSFLKKVLLKVKLANKIF